MKYNFRNLRQFISALKAVGELKVIDRPVSPYLEISKLTDMESKSPQGGKALYFPTVEGSPFPAATNLFGSPKRICLALGVDNLDQLADRMRQFIELSPPKNMRDMLSLLPTALSVTRFFPRRFRGQNPPCQEVVYTGDDVDLSQLPVLHCWPQDAGPFVTLPLVITRSLNTGRRNVGMYRLQIFDKNTTGMHWHIHKDGSHYYNEYGRAGRRMPVAVAIGADPAVIYAATAPMPRNLDEMILAGFIRGKPVPMTRCRTVNLEVPAEAEFVIEGYVDPGELRREGPFGDHTGYYSLAGDYPVFHVTAIAHRKAPVYCATLVGRPPMEDCYLAQATERLFLPLLQTAFPEIVDYWLPWEGVFHNIVVVAIEKEFPGHAQKIMHGLWGQGQMSMCKVMVIVDRDVDLKKPVDVMETFLDNFDLESDLTLTKGVLDVLDHSSPHPIFGHKLGIDLTARFPGEPDRSGGGGGIKSIDSKASEQIIDEIQDKVEGVLAGRLYPEGTSGRAPRNRLLCLNVARDEQQNGKYYADRLQELPQMDWFNIIILYDHGVDLNSNSLILWKLFNNVDPGRDMYIGAGRVVIDACIKGPADGHDREWPDELTFEGYI